MPSNPAKPFLVSRTDDPQLQLLNSRSQSSKSFATISATTRSVAR